MKRYFVISRKFMIFLPYLLVGSFLTAFGVDRYRFKGPKFQAPESTEAVRIFRQKCIDFKIEYVCARGFNNLVRLDMVDTIWFQPNSSANITTIGLTEFSVFSPLMKISIDKRLLADKVILDTTIIHELGHAILDLDHDDSKLGIMNAQLNDSAYLEQHYERLIDEMFIDYIKSQN